MEAFRMTAMAFGNVIAQAVYVAARLGIADLLEAGPKSVDELARASGAHAPSLRRLLRAHPDVRGALYDLPHVVKEATVLDSPDLRGRTSRLGGDFLQSVPALFDAYVLKRVLHDWDDDTCVAILRRCREGLPAAGRVLAIDAVVRPGNEPDPSKVSDLLSTLLCPGREGPEAEFAAVYAAAGLRLTRVIPTPTPLSIVEGAPA